MKKRALTTILVALSVSPAAAEPGRFVLERTDNGYVRMDTQTGDMALCAEEDGQIICRSAADERAAFQQQLDALDERITGIEQALDSAVRMIPDDRSDGLPSAEEFESSMDYMEQFFQRFRGIVEDF